MVPFRSRVRHAAYPERWTSGLLGGSSIEIFPVNLMWPFLFSEGGRSEDVFGGTYST